MNSTGRNTFQVVPAYQPLVREVGLDAQAIFSRDDIKPWRTLPDRENCTLDTMTAGSGTSVPLRLHIKRFPASVKGAPAQDEIRGIELLQRAGIPTVPLVGWGSVADGRSFLVTLDLEGYRDAEKLVQSGAASFDELLEPTADLAAKLHAANLHHRDLYLCHFFARRKDASSFDVALIDAARVKQLPRFFRDRWIVKDLAQFWYSTMKLEIPDEQRDRWLKHYAKGRPTDVLCRAIDRKARWIARHDRSLNAKQPARNVSIPNPL